MLIYLVPCAFKDGADCLHIAQIVGFFARRFEDSRFIAQLGTRCKCAETVEADVSLADVMVAIAVAAERHFRVVEVEHVHAIETDLLRRFAQKVIDAAL
jgi:hypothetical protein